MKSFAALFAAGLIAAQLPAASVTQIANAATESISIGNGGYTLNFSIQWSCDDAPQNTASAPGRIDLIDANGNLAAQLVGTASGGSAAISVTGIGAGSVSNAASEIAQTGAGGTPANGTLGGTWNISGVPPGAYTLNLWSFQEANSDQEAGTIWTSAFDAGGSGPVADPPGNPPAPPSPDPTPPPPTAPPPSPSPAQAQPPQPPSATIWADTPSIAFGQSTSIHAVFVPGANDTLSNSNIDSPEGTPAGPDQDGSAQSARDHSFTPASAGSFTFYARINTPSFPWATYGSATVGVAKADQSGIAISPAACVLSPGQGLTFTATGGATGNYAWGGAASGGGPSQTLVFPAIGTSTVSVRDVGNADFNPSADAVATISVNPIPVTFEFSGGPSFSFDGTPKAIAVSASPAGATFITSGTYSATAAGNYAGSAQATGNYTGSASYPWSIGLAAVPQPSIIPADSVVMPGQSVLLYAVGGATGNYVWGGAATGIGAFQFVAFGAVGSYVVTVIDSGDSTHQASRPASATVTVQPTGYTLSVTSDPGGTAVGGGFYEANTMAVATAAADASHSFNGWSGDVAGPSKSLFVYMDSDKSVTAHFSPLLAQVTSVFVPPGLPANSPPFALSGTSTSGLPLVFAIVGGPGTLSGDILTLTGASGLIQITATQPGNGQYLPAPAVTFSIPVTAPPRGVWTADDSATTRKNDRDTRNAGILGGAPKHP